MSNNISLISSLWSVPREDICSITHNPQSNLYAYNESHMINASINGDLIYMKHRNKFNSDNADIISPDEIEFMLVSLCTE